MTTKFIDSKHHRDKSVVWGIEQDTACRLIAELIAEELQKDGNRPKTDKELLKAIKQKQKSVNFQVRNKSGLVDKELDITPDRLNKALGWMKGRAWLGSEKVQVKSRQGWIWDYARFLSKRYYVDTHNTRAVNKKVPELVG